MMKVRILDQCEFCDGEVSMREARRLTAIDHVRCAYCLGSGEQQNGSACDDHQPQFLRAFVAYHFSCFSCSIDETVDPRRTRGNLLRIV
jgi:hypothetical protein